jgi:hypothetical protein
MQAVSELNDMGCAGFADVAAELALGALTGRERAEALAHLDRCAACRKHVRQLTATAEEILGLLPAEAPPPGFETRVLERLCLAAYRPGPASGNLVSRRRCFGRGRGGGQPGVSRPALALAALAVTLAIAVSALGGWGLGAAGSSSAGASSAGASSAGASSAGSSLSSAVLLSASRQAVGTIYFYGANRQGLFVSVDTHSGTGTVICQLVSPGGNVVTLGSFWLHAGYGAWGSSDLVSHGQFTGVRLVSPEGAILATASFPLR